MICDGGTAANGLLTSLGVTASGLGICQNSGPTTGAFNRICLGVTSAGGTIDLTNVGGATGGLSFSINGVAQGIPSVALPVIVDDFACWATTGGQLKDCGALPNIAIANHAVAIGTGIISFRAASPIIGGLLASTTASADPAFTQTPTLGASGTLGSLTMGNGTSGLLTLQPVTGALGTVTVSLPAATDTLVGKATTDVLTNKTYDTAGTGNSFLINGLAATANTGTGAVVRATNSSIAGLTVTGSFTATGLVGNASLANSATTVNGQTCTLGSTCTVTAAASSLVVGTTTVTSGTSTRILYNNAGTLGEYTLTGTGTVVVMATAPTIAGGAITALSTFSLRSSAGAFDLTLASTDTSNRSLTLNMGGANRTISLAGDLSFAAGFTTSAGGGAITLATTGTTSITLPTSGTLATLAGSEALTNKTINGLTITSSTGTLTIAAGKTLTASNTLTFTGTDGTSFAFPGTSDTVVGTAAAQTLTSKTLTAPTINGGTATALTGLAIRSTGSAFDLTFATTDVMTAGRTLTFNLNNAARTFNLSGNMTLSGDLITSGSSALTFTTAGTTNVTLPTTGTLVNSAVTTLSSLVSVGTLTTGALGSGFTAVPLTVGGTGQTSATLARGSTGLNIDSVTTFGNANYTVLVTDRVVATSVSFGAQRTVTLPTVASFNAGQQLVIVDSFGAINGANTMVIAANAADSINGTASITITTQYSGAVLWPIGSNKWGYIATAAGAGSGTMTSLTPGAGLVSSVTAACSQGAVTVSGTFSLAECTNAQTGTSYAIVDGDRGKLVTFSNTSSVAVTIAQAGAASAFQTGWHADISNTNYGAVTITPTTSTINGASAVTLQRGQRVRIVSDGTNYFLAAGMSAVRQVVQIFTSSTTYTPTTGMTNALLECWGSGGGGGGVGIAPATTGRGGGGGGAGGYSRKQATAADIGASKTVTIGAAGAASAASDSDGGAGNASCITATSCVSGQLVTANGGAGGLRGTQQNGGLGGTTGTTDDTGGGTGMPGNPGNGGVGIAGQGGNGGSSAVGGGGRGQFTATTQAGTAGTGFGSGGSGAASFDGGAAAASGAGTGGYCRVTEQVSQ